MNTAENRSEISDTNWVRWIHFSDLHFKFKNYKTKELRQSLENDIKNFGQFDYVVITGDICHQGNYDKETVNFVKRLITLAGCQIENVIISPGNHDAKRSRIRKVILDDIIKEYFTHGESLKIPNEGRSVLINEPFEIFRNLYFEIKGVAPPSKLHYIANQEACVINDKINFIVLNTAVFSGQTYPNQPYLTKTDQDKENTNLFICEDELSALTNNNSNLDTLNIVIAHHAVECFNNSEKKPFLNKLGQKLNTDLYLCGHSHKISLETIDEAKWQPIQVTCGGLFEDDYNQPSFVTGEFNPNSGIVILTNYTYIKDRDTWSASNAPHPYDENGVYEYEPKRLKNLKKTAKSDDELIQLFSCLRNCLLDDSGFLSAVYPNCKNENLSVYQIVTIKDSYISKEFNTLKNDMGQSDLILLSQIKDCYDISEKSEQEIKDNIEFAKILINKFLKTHIQWKLN